MTEAERFGSYLLRERRAAGVSQEWMAETLGVGVKMVRHWEQGHPAPRIDEARDYLRALGISPLLSERKFTNPGIYDGLERFDDADKARAALVDYIGGIASDDEVLKEAFLRFGDHGSAWAAMLEMYVAEAQCPLPERMAVASCISANYQRARAMGRVIYPDKPQPNISLLDKAIEACREAIIRMRDSYIRFLSGGAEREG